MVRVSVAYHDVSGKDRRVATSYWSVDFDRLMMRQVGRSAWPVVKCRETQRGYFGRVAKAAVGDDSGRATNHQPCYQNPPGGCSSRIFSTVYDHHRAGRAFLNGLALRVRPIAKGRQRIEVFSRGHVAERECLADHAFF